MTENLSKAQWSLIKDDINRMLVESDSFKELRSNVRLWIADFESRQQHRITFSTSCCGWFAKFCCGSNGTEEAEEADRLKTFGSSTGRL